MNTPTPYLKYVGNGASLYGIPAKDLTREEAEIFGETKLVSSGLYIKVVVSSGNKMSVGPKSNKSLDETSDEKEL